MRSAEAHVTLGVVAVRQGDVERGVHEGSLALAGERTSLPSLLMVAGELVSTLQRDRAHCRAAAEFNDRYSELRAVAG
jgi:hypothetical protein